MCIHLAPCHMLPPFSCTSQCWSQPTKTVPSFQANQHIYDMYVHNHKYAYIHLLNLFTLVIILYVYLSLVTPVPVELVALPTPKIKPVRWVKSGEYPDLLILRWAMEFF